MQNISINIEITKKQEHELTADELRLIQKAKEATHSSYAPYSHFSVGASLLLDDGSYIIGCNQENSSYPCGICAERSALFAAGAQCPEKKIIAICIAARDTTGEFTSRPISPCGACRQVMVECQDRYGVPMKVLLYGTEGTYILNSAKDLLPLNFDGTFL